MPNTLVIAGPTASGKTALALALSQLYPIEIVSADASMVYSGMDIGTAKPSREEQAQVPHHLIDVCNPSQAFGVTDFLQQAKLAIEGIHARGRVAVVVGGTGYYIRALTEGLYDIPTPDAAIQQHYQRQLEQLGLDSLIAQLEALSLQDAQRTQKNPRKVIRALELWQRFGHSPAEFPKLQGVASQKFVLWPEFSTLEPLLYSRINRMLEQGLLQEVAGLHAQFPDAPTAFGAIGYKELIAHQEGQCSLQEAVASIKHNTRAYAKRQYTWFAKEPHSTLLHPQQALEHLMQRLA